jgi:hypothetical protein
MKTMKSSIILFIVFTILFIINNNPCDGFVPAKIIDFVIGSSNQQMKSSFGEVSETITHESIIKR